MQRVLTVKNTRNDNVEEGFKAANEVPILMIPSERKRPDNGVSLYSGIFIQKKISGGDSLMTKPYFHMNKVNIFFEEKDMKFFRLPVMDYPD